MSELTELRLRLRLTGFSPLPVMGKAPPMEGWPDKIKAEPEEIALWEKLWHYAVSTGILCRYTPCLDIDIYDKDAADAVEELVRDRWEELGNILVRTGMAPKRAILFRTDDPFKKIQNVLIRPNGVSEEKIDFLGDGQQVVCFGIHEKIGKPYSWFGGEPGLVRREALP